MIDKGIPIPTVRVGSPRGRKRTSVLHDLMHGEVGDSVFLPDRKRQSTYVQCYSYGKELGKPNWFTVLEVKENGVEGVRVWKSA